MNHEFTLFSANYTQQKKNVIYPYETTISNIEDLLSVTRLDHVMAAYKNNHRANEDFLWSDCLAMDCDNGHSDAPEEWKQPDDLADYFPDVEMFIVFSRSHMMAKDGKEPRPRFHVYFPIVKTTDIQAYAAMKDKAVAVFPYFDLNAKDGARFFFGCENGGYRIPGDRLLTDILDSLEPAEDALICVKSEQSEPAVRFVLPDIIPSGERYKTLFRYGCQLRSLGKRASEIKRLMESANRQRCTEPLPQEEVLHAFDGAMGYEAGNAGAIGEGWQAHKAAKSKNETASAADASSLLNCFKPAADFEELQIEWLIQGRIPRGEITTLGSDGGCGKSTWALEIARALTTGTACLLDAEPVEREPETVAFLSAEDDVSKVLRRKLRISGADATKVICPVFTSANDSILRDFKIGSAAMSAFVSHYRPALVVIDPLQAFLAADVNMGARNQMRAALQTLSTLGGEYGTAFLILCHTNKRAAASGRDRLADSTDLWDISRSVMMAGRAPEDGAETFYLSQEKSSYGARSETVLYQITADGLVEFAGTTTKRDSDFQAEQRQAQSPKTVAECGELVMDLLLTQADKKLPSADLDKQLKDSGYSLGTIKRAKAKMKTDNRIRYKTVGFGESKIWYTYATLENERDVARWAGSSDLA